MSAFPVTERCPACGAETPLQASFCPTCGELLAAEHEPGPVSMQVSEPRWFGVTPPQLLLAVAGGALVLAIVLFAVGHWAYGLILLGIAALLLAAFLEAARRRPDAHPTTRAGVVVRERTRSVLEELRARSVVTAEARRIQSELLVVETERRQALTELGEAAHARNGMAEAAARATLTALDEREWALKAELEARVDAAGERIRRARLPVQETMMVLPPEPTPPPDEATPPQPAVVPEPYPPPDEGDPPEPAVVLEPSPEPGPEQSPDNPRED